jgi:hypothetical protein
MIRYVVGLGFLKVGQQLSVTIVSHRKLEMVKENHFQVLEVRVPQAVELNIPFCITPYKSALKKVQLDRFISQ